MASPTQWTRVWVSSMSWWWTGGLACCSPGGRRESDTTERLNWRFKIPQVATKTPKLCSLRSFTYDPGWPFFLCWAYREVPGIQKSFLWELRGLWYDIVATPTTPATRSEISLVCNMSEPFKLCYISLPLLPPRLHSPSQPQTVHNSLPVQLLTNVMDSSSLAASR